MTPARTALLIALVLPLASAAGTGADWPQWRGPLRNGISRETGWLDGWKPGQPPRVAWRAAVGKGHSAVSVRGDRVYTMGWDGARDTVFCLDAASGRPVWQQSYPCATIVQWPGPRSTPTIAGDTVYTLGQHGQLHAYEAESGRLRWGVRLPESYQPDVDYGFAWSPLVEGGLLILGGGSRGLGIRTSDGGFAWGNDGRHGACASPVPFEWMGRRGVVIVTTNPGRESVSLVGVDPRDGRELWRYGLWTEKWGAACVDPVVHEGKVFLTTAEQHLRSARFTIRGSGLVEDWSSRDMAGYTGGCVLWNGFLYGITKLGRLKCLDWNTGAEKWSEPGFDGFGTLMAADGKLIVQTSRRGELVIAEAVPDGYRELRRARVFTGPPDTFTVPVLAGGRIYCRSYAGELVCLNP